MTRRRFTYLFGAAIAFQILVLARMVARAATPLWTSTEFRLSTIPVYFILMM